MPRRERPVEDDPEYAEILADCTRDLSALGFPAATARDNWQKTYERAVEQARVARLYAAVYTHLAEPHLVALEPPTDSGSGDAQHNPDVWELRSRITALIAENRGLREENASLRAISGRAGIG